MSFDPIAEKRTARWTKQELKTFWQGPDVQRTRRENPALYRELHEAGERAGVVGKSMAPIPAPNVPYKPPTRSYTADELVARGQYSEQEIRKFFNSEEANKVFTSDRNEYERKREAGVSYGLFDKREVPYVPTKPAEPDWTMRISDELARESNLPIGTIVNSEQLEQLCEQKVQRARQAQAAADAKAAADRQAELAKLTAAQQLEQTARDQKQRDLDRLVELTTPKQTPAPEPAQVATARLVAQEKATAVEVPVKA
jgi:hypothetical protein